MKYRIEQKNSENYQLDQKLKLNNNVLKERNYEKINMYLK